MPVAIACPSCDFRGNVPDTFRGKKVKCRKCGALIAVPAQTTFPAPVLEDVPLVSETTDSASNLPGNVQSEETVQHAAEVVRKVMANQLRCPFCSELIQATAKKCKHCGEWLNAASSAPPAEEGFPELSLVPVPLSQAQQPVVLSQGVPSRQQDGQMFLHVDVNVPSQEPRTDAPGVISLIFGCLSLVATLMGFFTCGMTYLAALPFALIGSILGFFGRGNMRVAGLTLNFLALIPAVVFLGLFTVAAIGERANKEFAEQEAREAAQREVEQRQAASERAARQAAAEAAQEAARKKERLLEAKRRADEEAAERKRRAEEEAEAKARREAERNRSVAELRLALIGNDRKARATAAEVLGERGASAVEAVPDLINALQDEDENVRNRVTFALEKLPTKDVVQALGDAVRGSKAGVATAAVRILKNMGSAAKPAKPALVAAMKKPDADLRRVAAEALLQIGPDADSIQVWLEAIKDKNLSDLAVQALGKIGGAAVASLIPLLKDADPSVRTSAAEAIGRVGPAAKEAALPLLDSFKDPVPPVRRQAAAALKAIGAPPQAFVPKLTDMLKDKDSSVRALAAEALGEVGSGAKSAVPTLASTLKDGDLEVRSNSIEALGKIGASAKEAVPALCNLLTGPDQTARAQVVVALCNIDEGAKAARPALEIISKVKVFNDSAATEALTAFQSLSGVKRAESFEFLGKLGDVALPFLALGLTDDSQEIRTAAAKATPVKGLIKLLKSKELTVRVQVVKVLNTKEGQDNDVIAPLVTALQDQFPAVRIPAGEGLVRIGKPAVPELVRNLKSEDARHRRTVARILGQIGPSAKDAVPALTQVVLKDLDANVSTEAREALDKIQRK